MYPTMPHMRLSILLSCQTARSKQEIVRLASNFNLPRFGEIHYQLPLEGAVMIESFAATGKPRSYVVIPARYASTRLPRKMLLRETGKTLLQHTYEAACAAQKPS